MHELTATVAMARCDIASSNIKNPQCSDNREAAN